MSPETGSVTAEAEAVAQAQGIAPETAASLGAISLALPGRLPEELRTELIAFRRDIHMHPELGNREFRTTAAIKARLEQAGLKPRVLPTGTGLICDIGT